MFKNYIMNNFIKKPKNILITGGAGYIGSHIVEEISHIKPNFFKSLIATHHLHMNDDYTVFDHCSFSK